MNTYYIAELIAGVAACIFGAPGCGSTESGEAIVASPTPSITAPSTNTSAPPIYASPDPIDISASPSLSPSPSPSPTPSVTTESFYWNSDGVCEAFKNWVPVTQTIIVNSQNAGIFTFALAGVTVTPPSEESQEAWPGTTGYLPLEGCQIMVTNGQYVSTVLPQ